MKTVFKHIVLLSVLMALSISGFSQKKINDKVSKYELIVPDSLMESTETGNDTERTFYDNVSGVVLMITTREGLFSNPEGYMNCSKKDLERELKGFQDDSTLRLISCDKTKYYTDEMVKLHFETKVLPEGLNRCMIYFLHHQDRELQFSFMYDKADEKNSLAYIEKVINSLHMR